MYYFIVMLLNSKRVVVSRNYCEGIPTSIVQRAITF